jgi:hypothetical protein
MQQSSPNVGILAAALAKAQAEISNPEKSLTATIVSPFPREGSRTFRYASLSTGLDLVRKCLGQHEIATIQATRIDNDSGQIKLTTTLVHASGEWVSSDWPVSPISDTATPHRLGAALTYARRYALFTLVGIAGEDDLDAPDLPSGNAIPALQPTLPGTEQPTSQVHENAQNAAARPERSARGRPRLPQPRPPTLPLQASRHLRDQLISELERLDDLEVLATWAHRVLPSKNQLLAEDAVALESAFSKRLRQLENGETSPDSRDVSRNIALPWQIEPVEPQVTVIGKPVRERDREHLRFIASQPCLVCGRTPSDAHHVKFSEQRAMGRKVSDKFTVPVCRLHHRELHRRGDERTWWAEHEIEPLAVAANLWSLTRKTTPDVGAVSEDRRPAKINGSRFAPGSGYQRPPTNNETKPILHPEAE